MTVVALALAVTGCKKDLYDAGAQQQAKETEFSNNFEKGVLGGQSVDPNQTWSTTNTMALSVTPRNSGTLKIYLSDPASDKTSALYTAHATPGKAMEFSITKPADATTLYAAVLDNNNQISDLLSFDATAAAVNLNFEGMNATTRAARRAPTAPIQPTCESANPIVAPTEPTDLPTASNAAVKITENTTIEWTSYSGTTVYIAPNVTLTMTQEWGGTIENNTKIYMSSGSKIVKTNGSVYVKNGAVIYNDGGTIEGAVSLENASIWNKGTIDTKGGNIYYSDNGNGASIYNAGRISANDFQVGQYGKLWNVGTVQATGTLKGNNQQSKIFNAASATITAAGFELNNGGQYLWNDGTMNIKVNGTGVFKLTNDNAVAVNHGIINAVTFDGSAGGKFFNLTDCIVNIDGATNITNANAVWVNSGIYNSGTFKVTAGGNQVFNNCHLNVSDKFTMGNDDGSRFVLQGDASVVCDYFDWIGDNYFWMGGNSLLLVKKTLLSNNNDYGYGFYNTTDVYSVISAKDITTDADKLETQWRCWYEGKIYIDYGTHFKTKQLASGSYNYCLKDGATFVKDGTAPVSWTATTCRPAYGGSDDNTGGREDEQEDEQGGEDPTMYYYYAFEDLGTTDDFDFNDVIIRLSAPVDGKSTVQLMAAGGTLAAQVFYGNTDTKVGEEVHKMFNVDTSTMVNTGRGTFVNNFPVLGTVSIDADADMANLPFGILVENNDGSTVKVTKSVENNGKAPLVIVVNGYKNGTNAGKWFWPKERVNIAISYETFGAWGTNASTNKSWYEESNYNLGTVMTY